MREKLMVGLQRRGYSLDEAELIAGLVEEIDSESRRKLISRAVNIGILIVTAGWICLLF